MSAGYGGGLPTLRHSPMRRAMARGSMFRRLDWVLLGAVLGLTWLGTLLVWSHGYTFTPVPGSNAPTPAVRDALLAQGYALIGSSYARGGAGWAVPQGVKAGVEAISIAKARLGAGNVQRVYAWGASLGGLITETLAETRPGLVNGVAPVCGVLAGTCERLCGNVTGRWPLGSTLPNSTFARAVPFVSPG